MSWVKDEYEIEKHPFDDSISENCSHLIIGTFPTYKGNFQFDYFYSAEGNLFWDVIAKVYSTTFNAKTGEEAKIERERFVKSKALGLTDMHKMCYRKNKWSGDENLYPILLKDIFSILEKYSSIRRIVLTSRTGVVSALGLFKTYFLQKGLEPPTPIKDHDNILKGEFTFVDRQFEIFVPYSTSQRLQSSTPKVKELAEFSKLVDMYKICLLS